LRLVWIGRSVPLAEKVDLSLLCVGAWRGVMASGVCGAARCGCVVLCGGCKWHARVHSPAPSAHRDRALT
jgi:hypothetical protein